MILFPVEQPMQTHPAIVHYALQPHAVELRGIPVPDVGEDDVLLEVGAVSVCGSDVHQAHNTHSWPVNVPVVLGHRVRRHGRQGRTQRAGLPRRRSGRQRDGGADLRRVHAVPGGLVCKPCPKRLGFGYGLDGAMAQYVRVPVRCLHRIPDSLPFDLACLAEPHAVAYQAMCVNSTIRPGDSVVVLGPGPIGLLCADGGAVGRRSADRRGADGRCAAAR